MSVFRTTNTNPTPRSPYPINPPGREPEPAPGPGPPAPDGPTERIDERRRSRGSRNRMLLVLTLVSLVALNVAAVAVLVAWRAGRTARIALAQPPPAVPASAAGDFSVTYAQEPLRVQMGCSSVMYLDLDEPRANAAEPAGDLRYDSRCGDQPPHLTLGAGAAGAQVQSSDTDADGCAKAIRTSPVGPGASIEVKKGVVLCVLTAAAPARMVLVEITEVGRTGTAGMRATSWKVAG